MRLKIVGKRPALTPDEAQALRQLVASGWWTRTEAAALFGINRRTAGAYCRREHKRRELA